MSKLPYQDGVGVGVWGRNRPEPPGRDLRDGVKLGKPDGAAIAVGGGGVAVVKGGG